MISFHSRMALLALVLFTFASAANAENFLQRADVRQYISQLSEEQGLDKDYLSNLFVNISSQQGILDAIAKPAERTLTWREYRPIFLTDKRVKEGREFIDQHRALLQRASDVYGVPINVIASIIGVETFYGRITGKYGVLESLATLAFDYPPRSTFFKRELTEFLVLSSAEDWDALNVRGSYAGAMGTPQFISSSYRQYSVDFDGDGRRDLFNSIADVVGSVANYLSVHGWVDGAPIAEPWESGMTSKASVKALVTKSLKPKHAANVVSELGFSSTQLTDATQNGRLLSVMTMKGNSGEEIWVGYQNFYVITRYNHSRLYALAVVQLADAFNRSVQ